SGGAASGPIAVTTAKGMAISARPFTVVLPAAAPTIAAFAPAIASQGTPIQVFGSNFDIGPGNTRIRQNLLFMSPVFVRTDTIEAIVPPAADSGHISVRTPDGSAVSTDILFVPPSP